MKPSPSSPSDNPSASNPHDNPCYGNDTQTAVLDAVADDGTSYLLPYAQFLYAEKNFNPALEKNPEAPPELLLVCFARAEVAVLGSGLRRLAQAIQKYELKFVKSADRRLAATLNTHITSVTVTLRKENV